MRRILLVLLFFLPVSAGEVNLSWNPSEGAAGYRVYSGNASEEYRPNPFELVTTTTPFMVPDCVQQFLAVTAFNLAGESDFSNELAVYARPVFSAQPYVEADHIAIDGFNFAPGITLTINNVAVQFAVLDCFNITVPLLSLPVPVQGQPMTFQLCNGPVCEQESIPVVGEPTGFAAT